MSGMFSSGAFPEGEAPEVIGNAPGLAAISEQNGNGTAPSPTPDEYHHDTEYRDVFDDVLLTVGVALFIGGVVLALTLFVYSRRVGSGS
jgi:hypothetical protein